MILADNQKLWELIFDRMKELDWKPADLLNDALERGREINRSRFSKYKNKKKGSLNDSDILWIMERLDIQFNLNFGIPVVKGGKLVYEIQRFSELRALRRVNLLFKSNG